MANDLLIAAIREAGLDLYEVADIAGADPRTVQRWLGGRIPHPRYRHKVAQALRVPEQDLWPETSPGRGRTALDEIVAALPRRSDPEAPDWRALLRSAETSVDLLGYSLHQLTGARRAGQLLIGKARGGCRVRIALADPDSPGLLAADAQERPPGRLLARVQQSHRVLLGLLGEPGIEMRQHRQGTPHTIMRFDEQLLLTIHLHGTPGFQSPLLHIRRRLDYGLFDQLVRHLEDVWHGARPLGAQAEVEAASPVDAQLADERERFLDSLDHVWRPEG